MSAPRLVYADSQGNIYDHPELAMTGMAGGRWEPVADTQVIPLPEGSELFLLPRRLPVGLDRQGEYQVLTEDPAEPEEPVTAVAAFMAPAHTATYLAAYRTQKGAPRLPMFAYAAVGFMDGDFVVTGMRTDPLPRQDPARFPSQERIQNSAQRMLRRFPKNRLWQHLGKCCLTYGCPAARNLMLGRWEAPLPTSPACNASCLGCLNSQPDKLFPLTQERMTFTPTPAEIAEVALFHLQNGRDPMVSFGQGCEGEPLLQADNIATAITLIRAQAPEATINLNTNGSLPGEVEHLMRQGLSSIRVSLNSLIPERHRAYYKPRNWSLEDAIASLKEAKRRGGHTSINLLCMPGVTDRMEEVEALIRLVEDTKLDLIQWRNLNIDPEVYLKTLGLEPPEERFGMEALVKEMQYRFPGLKHGYFNPKL